MLNIYFLEAQVLQIMDTDFCLVEVPLQQGFLRDKLMTDKLMYTPYLITTKKIISSVDKSYNWKSLNTAGLYN